MATLNRTETQGLSDAMAVLETIQKEGYDPKSTDRREVQKGKALKIAYDNVKVVWTMKGYYSL